MIVLSIAMMLESVVLTAVAQWLMTVVCCLHEPKVPDFWFGLEAGEFAVGFQSHFERDESRSYSTTFDRGQTYGGEEGGARPILIQLWYPAEFDSALAGPDDFMLYDEYFDLPVSEPAIEELAVALTTFAKSVVAQEFFAEGEFSASERAVWERFLATRTACLRDAAPASGPFPLVLYHSSAGSSFEDHATLAEYLASHGFVVLSSAYQKRDGSSLATDGGEGSVADLHYLREYAATLSFVDDERAAVAGHSLGAQASLRYLASPDAKVDAAVLLDTTQDYYSNTMPTFRPIVDAVLQGKKRVHQHLLFLAGPRAMFDLGDQLSMADRAYLTVPELDHNEFISQGLQRHLALQWLADEIGQTAFEEQDRIAPVHQLYAATMKQVRQFLEARLGDRSQPWEHTIDHLQGGAVSLASTYIELAATGVTAPTPHSTDDSVVPTPRQFRELIRTKPMEDAIRVLHENHGSAPESPVYKSTMFAGSMLYELTVSGRVQDARRLLEAYRQVDLDGLSVLRFLANFSGPKATREILEVAVQLAPDNPVFAEQQKNLDR